MAGICTALRAVRGGWGHRAGQRAAWGGGSWHHGRHKPPGLQAFWDIVATSFLRSVARSGTHEVTMQFCDGEEPCCRSPAELPYVVWMLQDG